METLPPAVHRISRRSRALAWLLVLSVAAATIIVAERFRSVADERRQAQVALRSVQAATQQIRAVAADSFVAGRLIPELGTEGLRASEQLSAAIRELDRLGVEGPRIERLHKASGELVNVGFAGLGLAQRGELERGIVLYRAQIEPVLTSMLADTEAQAQIEDRRAGEATRAARAGLIAGVMLGLVVLAWIVRRLEAAARRHRSDAMMRRQAFTDPLTSLPNRAALELALAERLAAASEESDETVTPRPASVAMALLDLDDLKTVNDSLGHGRGDDLVRTIGARIAASLGPHDFVARFGGDEFGVLFADASPEHAIAEVERVLKAIHRPVRIGDRDVRVTASAGVATGSDVEAVVRDADIAMYAAKTGGKDRVTLFTPEMRADALANLELTGDLRRALTRDELFVEYQPIVALSRGRVDGVEALVRWMHPQRGRMPPLDFIGLAERTGLIGPLGWWVMRTACQQMVDWMREGSASADQHVSVNVSPIQLAEPEMAERIAGILRETGLSPKQLQLEITESVLVDRPEALVDDLTQLMSLGVRIAIDDFGTGHSVLAYLKDLPVDVLKIDKAFVDEIDSDVGRARLTQGIVQLAQALNLSVVAEGIETAPQASLLHGLGEMLGQGFLYSRPVAPKEAGRLLRDANYGPTDGIASLPPRSNAA